jgi:hypothetical protein
MTVVIAVTTLAALEAAATAGGMSKSAWLDALAKSR